MTTEERHEIFDEIYTAFASLNAGGLLLSTIRDYRDLGLPGHLLQGLKMVNETKTQRMEGYQSAVAQRKIMSALKKQNKLLKEIANQANVKYPYPGYDQGPR